jgi:predicted nucleotidyltransferase
MSVFTRDEQRKLIACIEEFLQAEPRIAAAWLAGSLGKGGGDVFSDIDILALAADGVALPALSADLVQGIGTVAPPVLVRSQFAGRVINVVTADWARFDISLVQGEELNRYDSRDLTELFHRGERRPPAHADVAYRTAPADLLKLVDEFFRVVGLTPVAFGRQEYQLALTGIGLLRGLTIDLMLEESGIAPNKRGGALHRNPFLNDEQRGALARLPPEHGDPDSIRASTRAFAAIFLPRAQRLAETSGMAWPDAFEAATRRHLKAEIGLEI